MNAGGRVTSENPGHWFKAGSGLLVSGLALALFFLQTGIDRYRTQTASAWTVLGMAGQGWLVGTLGVLVWATLVWALARACGKPIGWFWVLQSYGWCYAPTLVSGCLGLFFSGLLGWHTALTFGLGAVVMACSPITEFHHKLTHGHQGLSVLLTVLSEGLVLLGWGILAAR